MAMSINNEIRKDKRTNPFLYTNNYMFFFQIEP